MDAEAHSCPFYLNLFLYFPLARQFLKSGITFTSKNLLARPATSLLNPIQPNLKLFVPSLWLLKPDIALGNTTEANNGLKLFF